MSEFIEKAIPKKGYLNPSFIILWQGNFISAIGTVVYGIALGFWVLMKTNSTTLMGLVSASVVIPKLFIGPIAGSIVDRTDKKTVLVTTDALAGLIIIVIAVLAFLGNLEVWMAVCAGFLIGITETFAFPAARAALPLIVPKEHLTKANASYSSAFSASDILGRSLGGILFQTLGAPIAFLINGFSYIYCAISEVFIHKMPATIIEKDNRKPLLQQALEGAKQVIKIRGLLPIFIIIAFLNYFGFMVVTFYIPLFVRNPALNPAIYGIVMACSTCGMLLGQIIFSLKTINTKSRAITFCVSGFISNLFIVVFPFFDNIYIMMGLIFLSGLSAAAINIVLNTALQLSIPSEYHGRVFSFVGMVGGLLVPLAMISAGIIAERLDIKILVSLCGGVLSILFVASLLNGAVRNFLNIKE